MSSTAANAKVILASALPVHLKPLATLLALYGDRDGTNIWPSVGRVAHELGIDDRTVQRHISDLIDLGVLIPQTPRTGGRGQTTVYALEVSALPYRAPYEPPKPRHERQGLETVKGDTDVGVIPINPDTGVTKPRHGRHKTPTPVSINPDTGVTRSGSDQGVDQGVDHGASRADAAAAAMTQADNEKPEPLTEEQIDAYVTQYQLKGETRQETIRRLIPSNRLPKAMAS